MKEAYKKIATKITLHLFIWILSLSFPFLILKQWNIIPEIQMFQIVTSIIYVFIFYLNYLYLFPEFYFKKKRRVYYFVVFFVLVLFFLIRDFSIRAVILIFDQTGTSENIFNIDFPPEGLKTFFPVKQMQEYYYVITSSILIFLSGGLRALEKQSENEKMQKELEREKLNSELGFLKNQLSPHFFFNTLNNIYSLVEINPDVSREAILKLSRLMRYMLYESQKDIKLSSEINFMKDFVDLMKLRMNDKVDLSIKFPEQYNDISVEPLLFIPFIENAFKHGVTYRNKSYINICLEADDNSLNFQCSNSKGQKSFSENEGIGLINVKKRLNLLYHNRYILQIAETESAYSVNLKIQVV